MYQINISEMLVSDTMRTLVNHPVHIFDQKDTLSVSSFIPFCMFGSNMTGMDTKRSFFGSDIEVCNSFMGKSLADQFCYEVDLDKFKSGENIEKDLKLGLSFVMDYNEDRQVNFEDVINDKRAGNWMGITVGSNYDENAVIHLNAIGNKTDICWNAKIHCGDLKFVTSYHNKYSLVGSA